MLPLGGGGVGEGVRGSILLANVRQAEVDPATINKIRHTTGRQARPHRLTRATAARGVSLRPFQLSRATARSLTGASVDNQGGRSRLATPHVDTDHRQPPASTALV